MRYYRDYMDRQQVSGALHDRLIGLEIPKVSGTKTGRWPKVAALAACCVLAVGLGMWQLGTLEGGQSGDFSGVVNTQGPDKIGTPGGNEESFLADSGVETDKLMMPNIVPVSYAGPEGTMEIAADIALPEGAFTMELTEEQICLILWGSQEAMAQAHEKVKTGNVPWLLNWDGYSISGTAIYAGTGELWQATLRGTSPEGGEFTITLAPGELPLTCVVTVDDTGKSVMEGVEVEARQVRYDRDGDGQEESVYESAFLAHGVGVRAEFVTRQDSLLSDLFINWAIRWSEGGLSLNHLLTTEAPAFRSVDFKTLNQARAEAEFSPYLPQGDPEGYGEFYGHLTWQEGIQNRMFVRWSRGYDDVAVWVERPERGEDHDTVDVAAPEQYDVRLYSIPWCDSVPWERVNTLSCPTFRAEDLSRGIVEAREQEKDTGGSSYQFRVLHPDGTLVEYHCSGLTVDQMWHLVSETLS